MVPARLITPCPLSSKFQIGYNFSSQFLRVVLFADAARSTSLEHAVAADGHRGDWLREPAGVCGRVSREGAAEHGQLFPDVARHRRPPRFRHRHARHHRHARRHDSPRLRWLSHPLQWSFRKCERWRVKRKLVSGSKHRGRTGDASVGVWGITPEKKIWDCICKIMRSSEFWPENGSQCCP